MIYLYQYWPKILYNYFILLFYRIILHKIWVCEIKNLILLLKLENFTEKRRTSKERLSSRKINLNDTINDAVISDAHARTTIR